MREVTGNNGAKIVINCAKFKEAKRLRRVFAQEFLKHKIDINNVESVQHLEELFNKNKTMWLNIIKDVLLGLEVSEDFEAVMWDCMKECTYDRIMITPQLFDDKEEAREDYDLIVREVVQENLGPFMKGLSGMLSTLKATTDFNQE